MRKIYFKHFFAINLIALLVVFISFSLQIHHKEIGEDLTTVEKIKKTGFLRLITNRSINNYYYYNGIPTGFEYDLAKEFADYLGVDLNIVTPGWNSMFTYLEEKKGDFIAAGLTITRKRLEKAVFSIPYLTVRQHIIHHKKTLCPASIEDFAGRTLHVRRGTSYQSRIEVLKAQGINLNYILHNNMATLDLIRMVNDQELKFTISDSNIAFLSQRYYPDIRIGIPLQEKESLAWAARKDDIEMLKTINQFILYAMQSGKLEQLQNKYYANIENSDLFDIKLFHQRIKTRLPKFKAIIKRESKKHNVDWRLAAAVVYQESHFNPNARSFTNVRGLMQVTTVTAEEMGIENRAHPEQSIKAGIRYLKKMMKKFNYLEDPYERMVFGLASYNIGYGHITDAMKIARKKGLDATKWHNVEKILPLLSKSEYYKKTKYGYARGWEPVIYVEKVMTYYDILRQLQVE